MNSTVITTRFTEEQQAELRRQVMAVVDAGVTRKKCADEAGIAYGTLTNWLGGTYAGDNDRIASEVARWLKAREERARTGAALPQEPGYTETVTTAKIISILQYAQIAPDIAVVGGDAGTGKTTSATEYCRTNPNAWMVTMDPSCSSANAMLAEICQVVGVQERLSTRLARAIGEQLKGKQALIVLDEAQHLSTQALEQIRSLHDKYGLGIALIGNVSIYARLEGGRTAQFAQLFSRVGMRLTKTRPTLGDIGKLLDAWGIEGKEERTFLTGVANKPGALRQMTKVIKLACLTASGNGGAPTLDHLRAAYSRLSTDTAI
ncbi:MAG: AAA family ATPase [Caenispirillum sp.]|nr:AAA family ATPase [Caenispirillum sp.]